MLLAIDIGNTNIVFGIFNGKRLVKDWRLHTDPKATADEFFISLSCLISHENIAISEIQGAAISCVVPSMLYAVEAFCQEYLKLRPLVVGPGISSPIKICIDNPAELGADRLVNAVAAFARHPRGVIVVDFGTATTFDYVSGRGEYLGGAIAPGVLISCEALFAKAARLPRAAIFAGPRSVMARDTVAAMNAGIVYGFADMADGIVTRMKRDIKSPVKVIATGGLASLIVSESRTIKAVEPHLTLEGLRLIYEQNV
ncbi:MAG: type III pantothenate kinase [Thermodesulfobacteriota bacterium]